MNPKTMPDKEGWYWVKACDAGKPYGQFYIDQLSYQPELRAWFFLYAAPDEIGKVTEGDYLFWGPLTPPARRNVNGSELSDHQRI